MVQWIPAFAGMAEYAICHSRESGNPSYARIIPPLITKEPEKFNQIAQAYPELEAFPKLNPKYLLIRIGGCINIIMSFMRIKGEMPEKRSIKNYER